jgi:hypothetical protein
MLSIRPNMCAERNWCWNARPIYLLLYLDRRRLKEWIHGRPRSDRKKRFLLSAVAPGISCRYPRKARPINWAQRGGLASGGKLSLLTPRPHFTAPSWTLGNQVVGASDGAPFCQERRPTRVCRTPGPVAPRAPRPHRSLPHTRHRLHCCCCPPPSRPDRRAEDDRHRPSHRRSYVYPLAQSPSQCLNCWPACLDSTRTTA